MPENTVYARHGTKRAFTGTHTFTLMPAKKTTKKVAAKKAAVTPAPAKKAPVKKAAVKKEPAAKKVPAKPAAKKVTTKKAAPSLDAVAKAAYLNYRRRIELGLPGDDDSDWLEAERSLRD